MSKIVLSVAVAVVLSACGPHERGTADKDQQALRNENISCVGLAFLEYDGWGMRGQTLSCKLRDGPFLAAEDGHLQIRGQYKAGKKVGIWRYYDEEGNLEKEIDHSSQASPASP